MRIARAIGSRPHFRRQLVPTVRSRVVRGRWNLSTGVEQPARGVSSVNVKPTLADQIPLASSLTLWVIRALIAGLVVVALIPNLILGIIFCAGHLLAELRGRWRGMRIARAIVSMPHLRRQLVPTVRSRPRRRRLQGNFSTAVEKPTQGVSWVNVKPGLADQTTPLSSLTLSLIRALIAGLVLIALIPNLMLGAIFWLGAVDIPWSRSPTITANDKTVAPPSAVPTPVLSSPAMLEATAGGEITFPIALDGTDGVPARSIIAIKGLPQGSRLSSGRPYDETEWNLKPDEIGDLHLVLPGNASGETKLTIQLVATDGGVIADAATVLKMPANFTANVGDSNINTELAEAHVVDEPAEALGATGGGRESANLDAATAASGDPVPLPTRRPASTSNDDANWITLTSVNLRERPTRSAPAIGVVARDAKLRVIGRKNLWVQVSDPTTSEKGWIYARHVATLR
jgi:Bacterial SH3 domain